MPLTSERQALALEHLSLAKILAAGFAKSYTRHREDLYSAAYLGLFESAESYDPSRDVDFEAFARIRIRGEMQDELRRLRPIGCSFDPACHPEPHEDPDDSLDDNEAFEAILIPLPTRDRDLLRRLYSDEESQIAIARERGCPRSRIWELHKEAILELRGPGTDRKPSALPRWKAMRELKSKGLSNRAIALRLGYAHETVQDYLSPRFLAARPS